jgi:hypothetical protein
LSDVRKRGNERGMKEGTSVLTTAAAKVQDGFADAKYAERGKSLRRFNKGRYGCMDG